MTLNESSLWRGTSSGDNAAYKSEANRKDEPIKQGGASSEDESMKVSV